MDATARRMWVRFEPFHDVTYFTPESRAATDALGCKGGWMGYFGNRAAPLGAAAPEMVVSAFYNFHPSRVHRALPEAWRIAAPERFLECRLAGVDGALRRLLGADVLAGPELAEAAELAVAAAALAPTAGRPLAAANAMLDSPAPAHLALWQASTVLRESRGDGHVAALVAAALDPCEALVLFAAEHGIPAEYLRSARGWPEVDWSAAQQRLADRGLVTAEGTLTDAGTQLRQWVEDRTDEAAGAPWTSFGAERTERLAALLTPLAKAVASANESMRRNPMALDAAQELS